MKTQVKLKKALQLDGVVFKAGTEFTRIKIIGENSIIRLGGKEFSVSSRWLAEVDQYGRPIDRKKIEKQTKEPVRLPVKAAPKSLDLEIEDDVDVKHGDARED